MTLIASSVAAFLQRATREAGRYGEDAWVFLRELVQNSRDAGARAVHVTTRHHDGWEILSFEDDGHGMNPRELERYLLRLYASSKEQDAGAVGFFGVGFWSVLRFAPEVVRITSRASGAAHGVEVLPQTRELRAFDDGLSHDGTRVTLYRRVSPDVPEPVFAEVVRDRLAYYAAHVRSPLGDGLPAIHVDGRMINAPFAPPPLMGSWVQTRDFDGVIGFGDRPSIRLYKGGILVRDLEDLGDVIPSRPRGQTRIMPGLHPHIALNIDGMKVLMDRTKIFEDPLLHKVVDYCEKRLAVLAGGMMKNLFPMNLKNRLYLLFSEKLRHPLVYGLVLLLLPAVSAWVGYRFSPGRQAAPSVPKKQVYRAVDTALDAWLGSGIDPVDDGGFKTWPFFYEGEEDLLFRLRTLEYDPATQNLYVAPHEVAPTPYRTQPRRTGYAVRVGMVVTGGAAPVVLPVPLHYRVVADSVTQDGNRLAVSANQYGDPLVVSPRGMVSYSLLPVPDDRVPPPATDPGITWPEAYAATLAATRDMTSGDAVAAVSAFLSGRMAYTRDPDDAARFEQAGATWLQRVFRMESGDCDVINGMCVLMLRARGIPAYLSVGLVGVRGEVQSDLHAWVRYYDAGWQMLDLTRTAARPSFTPIPVPTAADIAALNTPPAEGFAPPQGSAADDGTPDEVSAPTGSPWWPVLVGLVLVGLAGLLLVRYGPRGRGDDAASADYISHLIRRHYTSSDGHDPLQLRFRPAVALLNGKRLSLYEINKLAARGPVLGARRDAVLPGHLRRGLPLLDRDAPGIDTLAQFLPSVVWLDALAPALDPPPLPAFLVDPAARLRRLLPDMRLIVLPDEDLFLEAALPFKDPAHGTYHVILGSAHPLYARLQEAATDGPFLALHDLVHALIYAAAHGTDLMTRLAAEAAADGVGP